VSGGGVGSGFGGFGGSTGVTFGAAAPAGAGDEPLDGPCAL
jgi:hypothetical protein